MLKIRRPLGRLIFNMGIAIPGKTVFLIETAPWHTVTWKNGQTYIQTNAQGCGKVYKRQSDGQAKSNVIAPDDLRFGSDTEHELCCYM